MLRLPGGNSRASEQAVRVSDRKGHSEAALRMARQLCVVFAVSRQPVRTHATNKKVFDGSWAQRAGTPLPVSFW